MMRTSTTLDAFCHTDGVTITVSTPSAIESWPIGPWRWAINKTFHDPKFLERLSTPQNLLLPPAEPVERIPPRTTTELVRLVLAEWPARPLFIKHYRPAKLWNTCKDCFRRSRARLAFENALLLQRLNIHTATPVAFGERRQCFFLQEAYLICEEVPRAITLKHFYLGCSDPWQCVTAVRSLARLMAALHNARLSHSDPHDQNFLVSDGHCENLVLIDLDALRPQRWFGFRTAVRDLKKMLQRSPLPARLHLRFAVEYARARSTRLSARKLVWALGP